MYRIITTPATAAETFHYVTSHLVHSSLWEYVDGLRGGAPVAAGDWPVPAAGSSGVADGDYVVLRPGHALLSTCGDRFQVKLDAGTLQITVHRKGNGTQVAWDEVAHAPVAGSVALGPATVTPVPGAGQKLFLYADAQTFIVIDADVAGINPPSGKAVGYLASMIAAPGAASAQLGTGVDPYPVCWMDLDTGAGDPAVPMPDFGLGECFNWDGVPTPVGAYSQIRSPRPDSSVGDVLQSPISFGEGVPLHVLTAVLVEERTTPNAQLRGTFPSVYLTSQTAAETVIRLPGTQQEYIVPAALVAFGPI